MKQGNVWNTNEYKVEEFNVTFEGRDWTVRRVTYNNDNVGYKRRDVSRLDSWFIKVPSAWKDAIDRVIDENKSFKIPQ